MSEVQRTLTDYIQQCVWLNIFKLRLAKLVGFLGVPYRCTALVQTDQAYSPDGRRVFIRAGLLGLEVELEAALAVRFSARRQGLLSAGAATLLGGSGSPQGRLLDRPRPQLGGGHSVADSPLTLFGQDARTLTGSSHLVSVAKKRRRECMHQTTENETAL